MSHEELLAFADRFTEILEAKEPMRTNRLVNLMDDLEQCYDIPLRNNEEYNKNNPEVMHLYRSVSKVRNLREVK